MTMKICKDLMMMLQTRVGIWKISPFFFNPLLPLGSILLDVTESQNDNNGNNENEENNDGNANSSDSDSDDSWTEASDDTDQSSDSSGLSSLGDLLLEY